jgi:hypothetical protein
MSSYPAAVLRTVPFVLLAFATGCTAIALSAGDQDPTPTQGRDGGAAEAGNFLVDSSADAGVALPPVSPLCANTTCRPDDPKACSASPADAGEAGTAASLACRVLYDEVANRSEPACVAAGDGKDGDPCSQGGDCKSGFECVGYPGRCRQYCCAPSECATLTSVNMGKTYFCDVQTQTAAPQVKVPVCLVAQPCELLKDKCGTGMTCALVDPTAGTTSCVMTGPAQQGQDCEKTHCASNLNCLGTVGARTCERLCDANHPCGSTQQCQYKFPTLKQQGVGICQ